MVCAIDPPVASIGSSTITGCAAQVVGQRLQIRGRLMGFLVAGDADEPDARLRDQRVRLVDHAEPGPQHRHQQRRTGQPAAGGLAPAACAPATLFRGRVAGGLVDEHQREIAQRRAEARVVGALVAQGGQPRGGQRVVDDTHIHSR